MPRNNQTSAIIDTILKIAVTGGVLGSAVIAPGTIKITHKPALKFLDKLDERTKEREVRRVLLYMRRRGYLVGDYEHGLKITKTGRKRLEQNSFEKIKITKPEKWDNKWRLVIFDIPEDRRQSRVYLTHKLKSLGFQHLQQSVWIHPFPCKQEVTTVCIKYNVSKYVTYLETEYIDHDHLLKERFAHIICK